MVPFAFHGRSARGTPLRQYDCIFFARVNRERAGRRAVWNPDDSRRAAAAVDYGDGRPRWLGKRRVGSAASCSAGGIGEQRGAWWLGAALGCIGILVSGLIPAAGGARRWASTLRPFGALDACGSWAARRSYGQQENQRFALLCDLIAVRIEKADSPTMLSIKSSGNQSPYPAERHQIPQHLDPIQETRHRPPGVAPCRLGVPLSIVQIERFLSKGGQCQVRATIHAAGFAGRLLLFNNYLAAKLEQKTS